MATKNVGKLSISLEADLKKFNASLVTAKEKLRAFGTSIEKSFAQGTASTSKGTAATEKNAKAQGKAAAATKKTEKATTRATKTQGKYNKKVQDGTKIMGVSIKQAAGMVVVFGAVGKSLQFVTGNFSEAISGVVKFDQGLANIRAITAASTKSVERLSASIISLAVTTPFAPEEIANAFTKLGQAGFTAAEATEAIGAVARLSIASLSDMESSVKLLTSAIRAFKLETSESANVVDIMIAAVNRSKLTVEGLNISMNFAAPAANAANLSVKDLTAAMGTMADAGIKASTQGTGLRQTMAALVAPTDKFKRVLDRLNLNVKDLNPLYNDFGDILLRLRDAGFSAADAFQGLERRTGATVLQLVNSADRFNSLRDGMEGAGAAALAAEAQMSGMEQTLKRITQEFRAIFLTRVIQKRLDQMLSVFQSLTRAARDLGSMLGESRQALGALARVGMTAATVWVALRAAMIGAQVALNLMVVYITKVSILSVFSFGGIFTAVTLVIGALAVLYVNFGKAETAAEKFGVTTRKINQHIDESKDVVSSLADEFSKLAEVTKQAGQLNVSRDTLIGFTGEDFSLDNETEAIEKYIALMASSDFGTAKKQLIEVLNASGSTNLAKTLEGAKELSDVIRITAAFETSAEAERLNTIKLITTARKDDFASKADELEFIAKLKSGELKLADELATTNDRQLEIAKQNRRVVEEELKGKEKIAKSDLDELQKERLEIKEKVAAAKVADEHAEEQIAKHEFTNRTRRRFEKKRVDIAKELAALTVKETENKQKINDVENNLAKSEELRAGARSAVHAAELSSLHDLDMMYATLTATLEHYMTLRDAPSRREFRQAERAEPLVKAAIATRDLVKGLKTAGQATKDMTKDTNEAAKAFGRNDDTLAEYLDKMELVRKAEATRLRAARTATQASITSLEAQILTLAKLEDTKKGLGPDGRRALSAARLSVELAERRVDGLNNEISSLGERKVQNDVLNRQLKVSLELHQSQLRVLQQKLVLDQKALSLRKQLSQSTREDIELEQEKAQLNLDHNRAIQLANLEAIANIMTDIAILEEKEGSSELIQQNEAQIKKYEEANEVLQKQVPILERQLELADGIEKMWAKIGRTINDSMAEAVASVIDGSMTMKEALRSVGDSFKEGFKEALRESIKLKIQEFDIPFKKNIFDVMGETLGTEGTMVEKFQGGLGKMVNMLGTLLSAPFDLIAGGITGGGGGGEKSSTKNPQVAAIEKQTKVQTTTLKELETGNKDAKAADTAKAKSDDSANTYLKDIRRYTAISAKNSGGETAGESDVDKAMDLADKLLGEFGTELVGPGDPLTKAEKDIMYPRGTGSPNEAMTKEAVKEGVEAGLTGTKGKGFFTKMLNGIFAGSGDGTGVLGGQGLGDFFSSLGATQKAGTLAPGGSLMPGSTTITGSIGAAASIGSVLGGPIGGLFGKEGEAGGSIGGAIGGGLGALAASGAIAGAAFLAPIATAMSAMGSAIGLGLNVMLPGLGIILGAVLGGVISKMFAGPSAMDIFLEGASGQLTGAFGGAGVSTNTATYGTEGKIKGGLKELDIEADDSVAGLTEELAKQTEHADVLSKALAAYALVASDGAQDVDKMKAATQLFNAQMLALINTSGNLDNLDIEFFLLGMQQALGSLASAFDKISERYAQLSEDSKLTKNNMELMNDAVQGAALAFSNQFPKGIDVAAKALRAFTDDGKIDVDELAEAVEQITSKVAEGAQALAKAGFDALNDGGNFADAQDAFAEQASNFLRDAIQDSFAQALSSTFLQQGLLTPMLDIMSEMAIALQSGKINFAEFGTQIRNAVAGALPEMQAMNLAFEEMNRQMALVSGNPIELLTGFFSSDDRARNDDGLLIDEDGEVLSDEEQNRPITPRGFQDKGSLSVTEIEARRASNSFETRFADLGVLGGSAVDNIDFAALTAGGASLTRDIDEFNEEYPDNGKKVEQQMNDVVVEILVQGMYLFLQQNHRTDHYSPSDLRHIAKGDGKSKDVREKLIAGETVVNAYLGKIGVSGDDDNAVIGCSGSLGGSLRFHWHSTQKNTPEITTITLDQNGSPTSTAFDTNFGGQGAAVGSYEDALQAFEDFDVAKANSTSNTQLLKDVFEDELKDYEGTFEEFIAQLTPEEVEEAMELYIEERKEAIKEAFDGLAESVTNVDQFLAVWSQALDALDEGILSAEQVDEISMSAFDSFIESLPGKIEPTVELLNRFREVLEDGTLGDIDVDAIRAFAKGVQQAFDAVSSSLKTGILEAIKNKDVDKGVKAFGDALKSSLGNAIIDAMLESFTNQIFSQALSGVFETIALGPDEDGNFDIDADAIAAEVGALIDASGPVMEEIIALLEASGLLIDGAASSLDAVAETWRDILLEVEDTRRKITFAGDEKGNAADQFASDQDKLAEALRAFRDTGNTPEEKAAAAKELLALTNQTFDSGAALGEFDADFQRTGVGFQNLQAELLGILDEVEDTGTQVITDQDYLSQQVDLLREIANNTSGDDTEVPEEEEPQVIMVDGVTADAPMTEEEMATHREELGVTRGELAEARKAANQAFIDSGGTFDERNYLVGGGAEEAQALKDARAEWGAAKRELEDFDEVIASGGAIGGFEAASGSTGALTYTVPPEIQPIIEEIGNVIADAINPEDIAAQAAITDLLGLGNIEGLFGPGSIIDSFTPDASMVEMLKVIQEQTAAGSIGDTFGDITNEVGDIIVNLNGDEFQNIEGEELAESIVTEIGRQINFGQLSAEVRKHTGDRS